MAAVKKTDSLGLSGAGAAKRSLRAGAIPAAALAAFTTSDLVRIPAAAIAPLIFAEDFNTDTPYIFPKVTTFED